MELCGYWEGELTIDGRSSSVTGEMITSEGSSRGIVTENIAISTFESPKSYQTVLLSTRLSVTQGTSDSRRRVSGLLIGFTASPIASPQAR